MLFFDTLFQKTLKYFLMTQKMLQKLYYKAIMNIYFDK